MIGGVAGGMLAQAGSKCDLGVESVVMKPTALPRSLGEEIQHVSMTFIPLGNVATRLTRFAL